MKGSIGDKQRILHILDAIAEIENYVSGSDLVGFKNTSMMRFAAIKQIEIIGEAARYITAETKAKHPHIAWAEITGLRNILVHEYFGIDNDLIWQIITVDIPELKSGIKLIILD